MYHRTVQWTTGIADFALADTEHREAPLWPERRHPAATAHRRETQDRDPSFTSGGTPSVLPEAVWVRRAPRHNGMATT
eukprot:m.43570 g.43570  ORF g.43570 m.43570 type:complete len:78 (+) comp8445_c1_seq1:209-442(+)